MRALKTTSFPALGSTATLVTPASNHPAALEILAAELDAVDRACSRFRPDSELSAVNSSSGRPVPVSALFAEAVEAALRAARLTGGLVDPTVGRILRRIGYDRDFAAVAATGPALEVDFVPAPGWTAVQVDPARGTVTVPPGVELDLGATAKALCADRAAHRAAEVSGDGVLVSLGGDISVSGPPPAGGWPVGITADHRDPLRAGGPTVSIRSGGLATSSSTVRRWERGGSELHHLVDPRTGTSARSYWTTVSVAAGSCLDANIGSCAAMIMGAGAPAWLESRGLPARLVRTSGEVLTIGGWTADSAGRSAATGLVGV